MVGRPTWRSWWGWEAYTEVRKGLGCHQEFCGGSGSPPECLVGVGRPIGSGREAHPVVREGSGDPLKVTEMSGVPHAGPGGVGRITRMP